MEPHPRRRILVALLWLIVGVAAVAVVLIGAHPWVSIEKGQYVSHSHETLVTTAVLLGLFLAGPAFGAAGEELIGESDCLPVIGIFVGPGILVAILIAWISISRELSATLPPIP